MVIPDPVGTAWRTASRTLFARLQDDGERDLVTYFLRLNESYRSADEDRDHELSEVKLLRSFVALRNRITDGTFSEQVRALQEALRASERALLPTSSEFRTAISLPFHPLVGTWPVTQTGLSFGSPVAFPNAASLNLVLRLFDESWRLKLKLKLGLFRDEGGSFLWETGCILSDRALGNLSRDLSLMDVVGPVTPHMMKRSTGALFAAMLERPVIKAIDLTPAFYHIVPFSLWLGGIFVDRPLFEESKRSLLEAVKHSLSGEADRLKSIHPTLYGCASRMMASGTVKDPVVSLLLYNKMVFDPVTGKGFVWRPPRMLRCRGTSAYPREQREA